MDPATRNISFKEAFCHYYNCPPEAFLQKALLYSYYWHAAPFVLLFHRSKLFSFPQAIDAMEQAGNAEDELAIHRAVADYRYRLKISRASSWTMGLRIRISGKRLLNLFAKVNGRQCARIPIPATSRCG